MYIIVSLTSNYIILLSCLIVSTFDVFLIKQIFKCYLNQFFSHICAFTFITEFAVIISGSNAADNQ